jgi:hypothetical protein
MSGSFVLGSGSKKVTVAVYFWFGSAPYSSNITLKLNLSSMEYHVADPLEIGLSKMSHPGDKTAL